MISKGRGVYRLDNGDHQTKLTTMDDSVGHRPPPPRDNEFGSGRGRPICFRPPSKFADSPATIPIGQQGQGPVGGATSASAAAATTNVTIGRGSFGGSTTPQGPGNFRPAAPPSVVAAAAADFSQSAAASKGRGRCISDQPLSIDPGSKSISAKNAFSPGENSNIECSYGFGRGSGTATGFSNSDSFGSSGFKSGLGKGRGAGGTGFNHTSSFQTSSSRDQFNDVGFNRTTSHGFTASAAERVNNNDDSKQQQQQQRSTSSGGQFGGFGTGFGSGFGSGFSADADVPREKPPARERYEPPTRSGGFMDWREVEKEMKRVETEKWAGLPELKKNFYVEDDAVKAMTEDEADNFRLSKNNIMVEDLKREKIPPKPVQNFAQAFKKQPEILAEIEKQSFKEPSPVQCQMWPIVLSGFDAIGIAQTGTGKTLAFLLPIFVHLDSQPLPCKDRKGPGCLILSPTRELALQIHSEVKKYRYKRMKSVCLYGGGDRRKQIETCLEGIDIVIATPGRLNDLVCNGCVNLRSITFVVLDEADRMLDMGFEPQIKKVLYDIRPDRQTVMTSATWPPEVRRLAESYTKDAFLVVIGSLDLAACHNVTQVVEVVREENKRERLFEFLRSLKSSEKIIVFVGKKSLVDDLSSDLFRSGLKCSSLHGDRDQSDRERALSDIRDGTVKILIATDVASRGLDILDITHVLNYDFPRHLEEYVHRVGRTGRAGKTGVSITYVTRYDWRNAGELIKILEEAKQQVPDELRQMADRYEQKLKECPEMANRRQFYRAKKNEPFYMEDYI